MLKKRRASLAARGGKLMREGEMKLLLDLTARKATFSGLTLPEDDWERVKKWFKGAKEGLVKVRYRVSEDPSPTTCWPAPRTTLTPDEALPSVDASQRRGRLVAPCRCSRAS